MIIVFNFLISLFCIINIIFFYYLKIKLSENYFSNHALIFILKLSFISMFIYFFIFNLSISNYKQFIISGYLNFTIFHIIEGIISQKKYLTNDKNK